MRELELKRVVTADFELRPERMVIPGASLAGRETRRVQDVYFDTEDFRLARWGVTLRWRDGERWMVKIPRPSGKAAVLDREEVHIEGGDPTAVPAEAVALVAPFARHSELVEVARFDTDRTVRVWRSGDGTVVGELVDDHVTAVTKDGRVCFREIEFELAAEADPTTLEALAEYLDAGDVAAVPKLVRALGDAAAEPADVVCPTLPKRPNAAEVIHAAIATSVHQLLSHVPTARLGTDPEGVHQARVATRRLRSDLRTFSPLLDKGWAKQLRRELQWLAGELGAVRDADVLDVHIASALQANPEIDADAGAEIRVQLAREREEHRDILLGHLADSRAIELFDHLVDAAADPRVRSRARRRAAVDALPPLVQAPWGALRFAVSELGPSPSDAELHQIRILAKRARYAAEVVAPAVGKKASKFAKAAASLQESLGDLHDSAVAAAWLEHGATAGVSARASFAAGRLAEQLRTRAAVDRTGWEPSYDKMRRRSRWLHDDT